MVKNYRSPALFIDFVTISVVLLLCLVAIFVLLAIGWNITILIVLYLVFLSAIVVTAFIAKVGLIVSYITDVGITSKILAKKCCNYKWSDINYVGIFKSYNYGSDSSPVYMLISANKPMNTKNIALTKNYYNEIVIRISKRNKEKLNICFHKLGVPSFTNMSFETMNKLAQTGYEIVKDCT
ncbi:MAG: hypothetical protein E7667_04980 [Ruminococcaceae bacterium]|nr:hypothetical protein [Oscillospiraceae bacterium]